MQNFINTLKEQNLITIIKEELDIKLEIPHLAFLEAKKEGGGKALLFLNPKDNNKKFDIPVLMNIYNQSTLPIIFGKDIEKIANEIEELLHLKPPKTLIEKFGILGKLFSLKNVFPKRKSSLGASQEIIIKENINLFDLPVLTTWEEDGGAFITAGQVYTQSLDGTMQNLGLYRIQIQNKDTISLHWQIHKDSSHFFDEYKKAKIPMPVSIAIGGDPLYFWCGQAPLPKGIFELLMYGFIKNKPANLVKCQTNELYVPEDADIVIEAVVEDVEKTMIEGPFGDHTGYYTLKEPFPFAKVKAITMKKNPIFLATVVGKPPIEDKYMGYATERIFLPLLKTTAPDLIDYHMPENGVFHNLILAKIAPKYPAHAKQIMHAFWGVGQMSFVKHAIFVDENAPSLTDYDALATYILNRLTKEDILITSGILDHLDHSSPKQFEGSKLGIDATKDKVDKEFEILPDNLLYQKAKKLEESILEIKQYKTDTNNPITLIKYKKIKPAKEMLKNLTKLKQHTSIVVLLDDMVENDLDDIYNIIWRVVNNIDAKRDVYLEDIILIDASTKNELDNFTREWPKDVLCSQEILTKLKEKGLLENV